MKRLSDTQFKRLSKLGFRWTPREENWELRFSELEAFHKRYGHCKVPRGWEENPGLRAWVLRQLYRKEALNDDRIQKLDGLGFRWLGPNRGRARSELTGRFVENGGS
jgi:hypothetical protein